MTINKIVRGEVILPKGLRAMLQKRAITVLIGGCYTMAYCLNIISHMNRSMRWGGDPEDHLSNMRLIEWLPWEFTSIKMDICPIHLAAFGTKQILTIIAESVMHTVYCGPTMDLSL